MRAALFWFARRGMRRSRLLVLAGLAAIPILAPSARAGTPVSWKPAPWSPVLRAPSTLHDRLIRLRAPVALAAASRQIPAPLRARSNRDPSAIRPVPGPADTITSCALWADMWPDSAPFHRFEHTMIYDTARNRLVVFGGVADSRTPVSSDVWTMSLAGTPQWTRVATVGLAPEPREGATAVYDASRDRMIVYGGFGASEELGDVWALNLGTGSWTQLTPVGTPPPARSIHSAIYDASRDRMVIFGGLQSPWTMLGDAWALTFSGTPTWSPIAASGTPPSPRAGHAAVYDAAHDRMVIFGGNSSPTPGDQLENDAWALSFAGSPAWASLATTGTPPSPREFHRALLDASRNRMIVSGGWTGSSFANDVWTLSFSANLKWTKLTPAGTQPAGLSEHSIVYDSALDRLVSFGGYGLAEDQIWSLTLSGSSSWSPIIAQGQPPMRRSGHTAVLDRPRHRMVVFGGMSEDGWPLNDVWAFPLTGATGWTRLQPSGTPPIRWSQCAVVDSLRNRLIVFGGDDGFAVHNDVWALSLAGAPSWTQLSPSGGPPAARIGASAMYDPGRDRMVVHGGYDDFTGEQFSDTWALSLSGSGAWTRLFPGEGEAPNMYYHVAIFDRPRNRMIVVGPNGGESDVWELSFATGGGWSPIPLPPAPDLTAPSAVLDGARNRMLVFGGPEVLSLPLTGAPRWEIVGAPNAFYFRTHARAVFDPDSDRVVVSAGVDPYTSYGTSLVQALSFPSNLYSVNVTSSVGGYATVEPLQSCYAAGTPITVTAVPDQGFQLTGWSGDAGGTTNPLTVNVSGNASFVAHFAQPPPVCGEWRKLVAEDGILPMNLGVVVFDPPRHRLLAFGIGLSEYNSQVWQMPVGGGPSDWQLVGTAGTPPDPRQYASLAYDSVRDRLLVYGGYASSILDDVWALSLSGTPTWTQVVPAGGPAGQRLLGSAIYDPAGDRLIVFGGRGPTDDIAGYRNDAWGLSLSGAPAWSPLPSGAGPSSRCGHAAVYDPSRGRMVVYGGFHGPSALGDVWALSLSGTVGWSQLQAAAGTAPPARGSAGAAYDPIRDRLLVYGGASEDVTLGWPYPTQLFFTDLFALSFRYSPAWIPISLGGTLPGSRTLSSAAYDSDNDRMVIVGGFISYPGVSYSSVAEAHGLSLGGGYWLAVAVQDPNRGSVGRSPVADCYSPGTQVTLTATPSAGNQLGEWRGDLDGFENPRNLIMDRDLLAVAAFGPEGGVGAPPTQVPSRFALERSHPNPFARVTRIAFDLPVACHAELKVYDAAGRLVRTLVDSELPTGTHGASWDGRDGSGRRAGAGIYFYRLRAGTFESTRRMALVE